MSAAHDLYRELSTLGVLLWRDGGQLRYRAPVGTVVPDLLDALRTHKADLMAMLATGETTAANDSAPAPEFRRQYARAREYAPDFWDKAALVRGDALLLTNHLVTCRACYARGGRYCEEGQRLTAAYEAKVVEVWH